jgi:hypothetical protein
MIVGNLSVAVDNLKQKSLAVDNFIAMIENFVTLLDNFITTKSNFTTTTTHDGLENNDTSNLWSLA